MTGSRSTIEYRPLPQDDPMRRQPDISLAKQTLQWQPQVLLEEGLRRTIEYFKTLEVSG
jgi:nucleoside-diphosphate-sugar epimerase